MNSSGDLQREAPSNAEPEEKITLAAAAARSRASFLDPSALNSTLRTPKGRLDCGTARKRSGPEPSAGDP